MKTTKLSDEKDEATLIVHVFSAYVKICAKGNRIVIG